MYLFYPIYSHLLELHMLTNSSPARRSSDLGTAEAAPHPGRGTFQIVAVTVEVTIGIPVPAPTPTPTGIAICPIEKRPEASATMPPASERTVMILPPEPSRKSVNVLRAVSNVVSAPANAGPDRKSTRLNSSH